MLESFRIFFELLTEKVITPGLKKIVLMHLHSLPYYLSKYDLLTNSKSLSW